jgi:acetyl esterase/lipase
MEVLKAILRRATGSRFVAAGYVTVVPTHRGRNDDPQSPGVVADVLAVLDHVRGLPATDPGSVALYGCSAGADLALDIAAQRNVAAVAIEEPASLFFTGMFNEATDKAEAQFRDTDAIPLLVDPQRFYTDAMRARTREKIGEITSPVFLLEGDQLFLGVDHHRVANEILVPELVAEGLSIERSLYPGQFHCFGMGVTVFGIADDLQEAMRRSFEDVDSFFKDHVGTQPIDVDESLLEFVSAPIDAE